MRGSRLALVAAPALVAGKLVSSSRKRVSTDASAKNNKFLSTFEEKRNVHYLNSVSIDGVDVYGTELASSVGVDECQNLEGGENEGFKEVTVCGVQFRALVYLKTDCSEADSHIKEVKTCDATKPADTCVTVKDGAAIDTRFFSNALSYKILPCDPEVPAPEVDLSGHVAEDVTEAEEDAAGEVAEA